MTSINDFEDSKAFKTLKEMMTYFSLSNFMITNEVPKEAKDYENLNKQTRDSIGLYHLIIDNEKITYQKVSKLGGLTLEYATKSKEFKFNNNKVTESFKTQLESFIEQSLADLKNQYALCLTNKL